LGTDADAGQIHAAIIAIMAEGPTVAKNRTNTQQNYQFRGIDDVYETLQPLLAKHQVHVIPYRVVEDSMYERQSSKGGTIIHVRQRIEFRFYASDGSFVACETTGEAMDFGGDKSSNKAMSAAMKYALVQTFCLPTGERIDTEHDSPSAGPAAPPTSRSRSRAQRPPTGEREAPPEAPETVVIYGKAPGSNLWQQIGSGPRLTGRQQARIKILQQELGIEDGPWREQLFARYGKVSSADLSEEEATDWATKLDAARARRRSKDEQPPT
jgi:hypothetical protein